MVKISPSPSRVLKKTIFLPSADQRGQWSPCCVRVASPPLRGTHSRDREQASGENTLAQATVNTSRQSERLEVLEARFDRRAGEVVRAEACFACNRVHHPPA